MTTPSSLYILSALCGTCDHRHAMGGCGVCELEKRQCLGWTAHANRETEIRIQELNNLIDFGGANLLGAFETSAILETLTRLEETVYGDPAKVPPLIVAVQLGLTHHHFTARETLIKVSYFKLSNDFWSASPPHAGAKLKTLAREWDLINQDIDPNDPTVAWASIVPGALRETEDSEALAAHILTAVDIDGRMYTVGRYMHTGEVRRDVQIPEAWTLLMRGDMGALGDNAVERVEQDALNDGHAGMMHLMMATRVILESDERITTSSG